MLVLNVTSTFLPDLQAFKWNLDEPNIGNKQCRLVFILFYRWNANKKVFFVGSAKTDLFSRRKPNLELYIQILVPKG